MQIIFYILFGVALAMVGSNQMTVMSGDWESGAVMGYAGAIAPFILVGLAYGAGRFRS